MSSSYNIANLFFEATQQYPQHIAIIHNNQKITYQELERDILKTAEYFKQQGISKDDRVLIFVPMSIDLYRIVLALFSIGAVVVFIDEWVSKERMELCCKIAQCKGFIGITKARIFRWFSKELRTIPLNLKIRGYKTIDSINKKELLFNSSIEDTALITFTTGSTGIPKAAKRTHGFLKEQFDALIEKIQPSPDDIDMPVLPIVLLINLGVGATSVITDYKASKPNQFKPEKVVNEIKQYHVTRITSSPFFIKELSKYLISNSIHLATVQKIFTGGAPVFPQEASIYEKAFPNASIQIVYGSTEAEPISSVISQDLIKETETSFTKGLLVGKPYHKSEVKIIPITDNVISISSINEFNECSVNQIGEIIVAGPHVLKEYYNNEDALKRNKIFVDGKVYHRTGDSGFLNADGVLYLTGRCSTLFKQNDVYISPFLIENYLQSLKGIELGTVLHKNSKILLIIELKDTSYKQSIEQQLNTFWLKFDQLIVLDRIPRDPRHNSKIDYEKLSKLLLV